MKLAGIFQDLEHLFQTISYGGHFVFFKMRLKETGFHSHKHSQRQVFIAINIPCKFGEDIFINE